MLVAGQLFLFGKTPTLLFSTCQASDVNPVNKSNLDNGFSKIGRGLIHYTYVYSHIIVFFYFLVA